jgi:hypothetical protein
MIPRPVCAAAGNTEWQEKLYEANHLYMMKLALIKTNLQENTTSRYHPSIVKTTSHIKSAEKVPNFAARWRAISNNSSTQKTGNKKNETRYKNKKKKNAASLYSEKKVQPNKVKTIIILISTYKNRHKHNAKSRSKKNWECLRQLYEAIIPTWWKQLTNKTTSSNKSTSTTLSHI